MLIHVCPKFECLVSRRRAGEKKPLRKRSEGAVGIPERLLVEKPQNHGTKYLGDLQSAATATKTRKA